MNFSQHLMLAVLALVALTFFVLFSLALKRVRTMRRERIHPQQVALRSETASVLSTLAKHSDNLQNLFEMPVLFYVLVILLMQHTQVEPGFNDIGLIVLAWLYVALRYWHSWIHCTYNKVLHRFYVFVASVTVLLVMWAKAVFILF